MRVSLRRMLVILAIFIVLLIIWNVLRVTRPLYTRTCHHSESFQSELHKLTAKGAHRDWQNQKFQIHTVRKKPSPQGDSKTYFCMNPWLLYELLDIMMNRSVNEVLRHLELTHFLCYGALWGQIRVGRTLPWANKAELCLFNEELTSKDEVFIHRAFKKNSLTLDYDFSDGCYTVSYRNSGDDSPKVVMIVFELDKLIGMYRRVGWKRRVLPPDCEGFPQLECFPPRLAMMPLPLKEFGSSSIPVPRESIEIQKYHFRDNWWREVPVFNC